MADSPPPRDPIENLFSLAAVPIAAVIRSFDQLRRGADELFKGLENFNRTMVNLNDTASRVNALLNEFEEPVRAVMPQVLATAKLAEQLTPAFTSLIGRRSTTATTTPAPPAAPKSPAKPKATGAKQSSTKKSSTKKKSAGKKRPAAH
jgi:hypothetical protein